MSKNPTQQKKSAREQAEAAGAKVPTDRAAKAEALDEPIPVSIELEGFDKPFEFDVDPEALDDADAVDAYAQKNPSPMFRALTGEHAEKFRARLRDDKGRVKLSTIFDFVNSTLEAVGAGKS